MNQYIILIDMRSDGHDGPKVRLIKDVYGQITIFDDIADAKEVCGKNDACKCFPCEIIDLDDLGWCD